MSRPEPRKTFGRYELLERLGAGGMAEVYLAKFAGPMGVSRYVALKRVLADLSRDEDLARMFVDEARLVLRLIHPAIVAVYDFGLEEGSYYLAMELVEGHDLRLVFKQAKQRHRTIPVECALFIVGQIARGLGYAHALTDGAGNPFHIVHRDVTPSNIILSYRGDVKLADFGIARAAQELRQTATEVGTIKGKVRYMSPEQARGESVDGRSDLFGLGTVLLESLTLKPAFMGESEMHSLRMVQSGVPDGWEAVKTSLPDDILPILARAMAPDREQRFQNGEEFAEALELALRRRDPTFRPAKLAEFMESIFAEERSSLRLRMVKYEAGTAETSPALSVEREVTLQADAASDYPLSSTALDSLTNIGAPKPLVVSEGEPDAQAAPAPSPPPPTSPAPVTSVPEPTVTRKALRWPLVAGALLTVGAVGILAAVRTSGQHSLPQVHAAPPASAPPVVAVPAGPLVARPGRVTLSTNALATRAFLDKSDSERSVRPIAAGGMNLRFQVPPGEDRILRVEADGFKTVTVPLRVEAGDEVALPVVLMPLEVAKKATARSPATAKMRAAAKPSAPAQPPAKKAAPGAFINPF